MPGVTCREFADFLADYLDGELLPSTRTEFDFHLSRCPSCVAYMMPDGPVPASPTATARSSCCATSRTGHSEAAKLLGLTPATVKVRLHQARQALRTILDAGLPQADARRQEQGEEGSEAG